MKRLGIFLLIGIVIIGGIIGCYFWYKNTPPITPDETALIKKEKNQPGLKTYRNDKFRFEFSYPEDVPVSVNKNPLFLLYVEIGKGMLNPYALTVEKTDIKDIESLNNYTLKKDFESRGQGVKEQHYITLAGEKARVTTFNVNFYGSPGSKKNVFIQIIHDGKLYSMLIWENTGSDKTSWNIYDVMLPTFKFLK
ncbi:MAG: hypothetical protein GX627_03140 [Parcubacteria group bacterium]|jgi:hypothetical protein|nr:hypothetical protein [Parcubacteria group bacterium]